MKAWKTNPTDTMTADEMSVFYKKFLDSNWRLHCLYNVSWYSKNVELLVLAARVNIQSLVRKLRKKEN
jgi:apoptogenic protein 1